MARISWLSLADLYSNKTMDLLNAEILYDKNLGL